MKSLTKFLAVFALIIIITSFIHSALKAHAENTTCPRLGNNLIDNIDPNVLVNLRMGYKNAGGPDNCPIIATFLFRTPDFQNTTKIQQFFQVAQSQNIQPIIRVASDNNGDNWQAIDPQTAALDAQTLTQFSKNTFAIFGNEVNLPNEWGGNSDPISFTNSFVSFATNSQNFKVLLPPLSLNGPNPQDYWSKVFETIYNNVGNKNCGTTYNWINKYISGFAFNVYGTNATNVINDFTTEVNQLKNAGNNLGCNLGFQVENKIFIISELGIPGGINSPDIAKIIWDYYQALKNSPYGSQIQGATSYVRDPDGKIHAFIYLTDQNGNLTKSAEYNQQVINLGGSTSHGTQINNDPNAIIIPPLGSLVNCPTEIKTSGKILSTTPTTPKSPTSNTATCSEIKPIAEPSACKTAQNAMDLAWLDPRAFCYPTSCSRMGGGGRCGLWIENFCNNPDWRTKYVKYLSAPCSEIPPNDKEDVGRCMAYYAIAGGSPSPTVVPIAIETNESRLPTCIPTSNSGQKCVTECSQPIQMNENLGKAILDNNCLKTGNCTAQIGLQVQDKMNAMFLPFAQNLADYFTGVLDAEHQASPSSDPNILMQQTGVVKKLLPADYIDKLKCDFIKYVQAKKANKQNTKYVDATGNEFMIYDKKITTIPCKSDPKYDPSYDKYWSAIPLFPNDESQGKIEFYSPTINTTQPIYVSIPEVARLASATAVLQNIFIPSQLISDRQASISADPKTQLPTYGQPIVTSKIACTPTKKWEDLYSNTPLPNEPIKSASGQPLTEYSRGVLCDITGPTDPNGSPICIIGENGVLNCYKQGGDLQAGQNNNQSETVQVRTTFPYLFEIAEQTIQKSTGFLRAFKPNGTNDEAFAPNPAIITNVKYYLPTSTGLAINDTNNKNGWQINFYRLGGLETARNFLLQLLNPKQ